MNIIPIITFWFVLTLYFIFQGIYSLIFGGEILIASFWYFFVGWIVLNLILVIYIIIRKKTKTKITNSLLNQSNFSNEKKSLNKNQYFIQTPLTLIHSQYIPIYGDEKMSYKITFNNIFQKWITLLDIFPIFSLNLKSESHFIDVKRVHPLSLRYQYNIYIDEKYIGKLEQHRLLSKQRIKNLLSYKFTTENKAYSIENKKLTTQTIITDEKNTIFTAKRSFFDLFKKKQTNMRGEEHNIYIKEGNSFTNEVWLGIYIQCILDKHHKD